jgi:hypothetical protein
MLEEFISFLFEDGRFSLYCGEKLNETIDRYLFYVGRSISAANLSEIMYFVAD